MVAGGLWWGGIVLRLAWRQAALAWGAYNLRSCLQRLESSWSVVPRVCVRGCALPLPLGFLLRLLGAPVCSLSTSLVRARVCAKSLALQGLLLCKDSCISLCQTLLCTVFGRRRAFFRQSLLKGCMLSVPSVHASRNMQGTMSMNVHAPSLLKGPTQKASR